MHDFQETDDHEFKSDIFNSDKIESSWNKPKASIPKGNRKYKVIQKVKEGDNSVHVYSELGEEFEYKPWYVGGILTHPDFAHIKIKIIYKNDIKINYKSSEEAQMDGFTNFNKDVINSKGNIYPFTGLRGDAKELWRKVKVLRTEKRIEFVQANSYPLQKQAIKTSNIIIWAWGYESLQLPFFEYNSVTGRKEKLEFKRMGNYQYEVDNDLRLIPKNSEKLFNIFGIGLGYSIKTTNKHINAEKKLNSRADGVRLYMHVVPYVLLNNLTNKKHPSKRFKPVWGNRATSLQRNLAKTYNSASKNKRVNSVAKNGRTEITPIEEVPARISKFKRSRQDHKMNEKLTKAYDDKANHKAMKTQKEKNWK